MAKKEINNGIVKENNPKLTLARAFKKVCEILAVPFIFISDVLDFTVEYGNEKTDAEREYEDNIAMMDD